MTTSAVRCVMAPPTRRNNSASDNNLTIDQKLDLLLSEVADIKTDNKQFREDIIEIRNDIKQFKKEVNESIELCFNKIEDCESTLEKNKTKINKNEDVIQDLVSENIVLKKQLSETKKMLRAAEQYSRSNCIEIHGVPEEKSERIMDIVKRVGRTLNFEVKEEMIDAVHRLAKTNNQAHRGIIVKFCRRLDLEQLRAKTRVKNGFSASELGYHSESKVFINLSLSRDTRLLWSETRNVRKEQKYKFAWISNSGKIFLRKEEGSPAILISDSADLKNLK